MSLPMYPAKTLSDLGFRAGGWQTGPRGTCRGAVKSRYVDVRGTCPSARAARGRQLTTLSRVCFYERILTASPWPRITLKIK